MTKSKYEYITSKGKYFSIWFRSGQILSFVNKDEYVGTLLKVMQQKTDYKSIKEFEEDFSHVITFMRKEDLVLTEVKKPIWETNPIAKAFMAGWWAGIQHIGTTAPPEDDNEAEAYHEATFEAFVRTLKIYLDGNDNSINN